jgi:hypothetical protein
MSFISRFIELFCTTRSMFIDDINNYTVVIVDPESCDIEKGLYHQ